MLCWQVRTIVLFSVYSVTANIFCASVGATDIIINGFAGGYSSLADSGMNIPIVLESCYRGPEVSIARLDAIACGVGVGVETPFWLLPVLRFNFVRQRVNERHIDVGGPASHNFREECRMSLEATSTTTFFWTDAGVELEIPRRSKAARASLVTGVGASLIYAEDRIHAGSKYVYHYELWVYDPVHFAGGTLKELRHEEKDIGGSRSSGFGLGYYILVGFRFHMSKAFSLTVEARTNLGALRLNLETGNASKELRFDNGTIGISCSYRL